MRLQRVKRVGCIHLPRALPVGYPVLPFQGHWPQLRIYGLDFDKAKWYILLINIYRIRKNRGAEMGEKKIDRVSAAEVMIWVTACVIILAAVPVFQLWLIMHYVGLPGFTEYLKSVNPAFYQFVITVMGVLAAVAGYLTYKSRQEAVQEVEKIKEEMEDKKNEVNRFSNEVRNILQKKIEEIDRLKAECEQRLVIAVSGVEESGKEAESVPFVVEGRMAAHSAIIYPTFLS